VHACGRAPMMVSPRSGCPRNLVRFRNRIQPSCGLKLHRRSPERSRLHSIIHPKDSRIFAAASAVRPGFTSSLRSARRSTLSTTEGPRISQRGGVPRTEATASSSTSLPNELFLCAHTTEHLSWGRDRCRHYFEDRWSRPAMRPHGSIGLAIAAAIALAATVEVESVPSRHRTVHEFACGLLRRKYRERVRASRMLSRRRPR
jgi:hypothetical protein